MFESFRLWLADRVFNLYMWLCPPAHNPFVYHETDADFDKDDHWPEIAAVFDEELNGT